VGSDDFGHFLAQTLAENGVDTVEAARQGMLAGWPFAQVAKVSREELEFLSGRADPAKAAAQLWHEQLRLLVITEGCDGCRYVTIPVLIVFSCLY
jgi:sugar/nucleoside kinase (ribokinase family)